MSTEPISRIVNPAQLASKGRVLNGKVPQQALSRFSEYLVDTSGTVEVRLRFKKKRDGNIHIMGNASSVVSMVCQFCLEPVRLTVDASIAQIVVNSEADIRDQDIQQDVLVVEDETVDLADIIEDELILNLPMVARHGKDQSEDNDAGNCLDRLEYQHEDEDIPKKSNPFAVLKELKVDE
jgi:uncharacterized protein